MANSSIIIALLVIMAIAYQIGLVRSRKVANSNRTVRLHSRPHHYAMMVALWAVVPAFLIWLVWSLIAPMIIDQIIVASFPPDALQQNQHFVEANLRRIHQLASNTGVVNSVQEWEKESAMLFSSLKAQSQVLLTALLMSVIATCLYISCRKITPLLRARHHIEAFVKGILVFCSTVAILTTIGIVLSMVGETLKFFQFISPVDFFFGTTWNPRFSSTGSGDLGEFGLLPLISGTLLVAFIALLVAIPLGLMVAVYLSEYASLKIRNLAKPVIEMLAGIPTIVYGFFALVTVGPFLHEMAAVIGISVRATSALTAGIVMGMMIIPFISSLADDIISQVPRTLRDASLGLGATRSETIRKVVLPAALPGIVGAVLLAASRAIGETMIVVMAAGNSPALTANPFEAVSTMTVTIVNQLTGDNDFASPQSLVAFALGLTLFVITLMLNILALAIVRKYREQYE